MMSSVANTLYAAPFAIIGSIGVVTQVPNVQRLLEHHKIDAYLMTAGKHKRTIDLIGEVTEEGKAKLKEELEDIHIAFQDHVAFTRPSLASTMADLATGEHWLAVQAKEKGLVDDIMTSDEYLESLCETYDLIEIVQHKKKRRGYSSLLQDLRGAVQSVGAVAERCVALMEKGIEQRPPVPMAV